MSVLTQGVTGQWLGCDSSWPVRTGSVIVGHGAEQKVAHNMYEHVNYATVCFSTKQPNIHRLNPVCRTVTVSLLAPTHTLFCTVLPTVTIYCQSVCIYTLLAPTHTVLYSSTYCHYALSQSVCTYTLLAPTHTILCSSTYCHYTLSQFVCI